jgi:2-keto-4-pentenoate hydratase/2-oxohepta-3-ene-1,7-dioic acid hydratase in catechol pathway
MWRGKNTYTIKPMGPWIETDVGNLDDLQTTVRVNGKVTIEFLTNNMIFGIERYMSAMSKYLTLLPGDMIWMGAEGASPNMKDGDVCEIEISRIGTLRNTFVREK